MNGPASPTSAPPKGGYRAIDPDKVVATAKLLAQRVEERFPDRGLAAVADEVETVAMETRALCDYLAAPHRPAQALAIAVTTLAVAAVFGAVTQVNLTLGVDSAVDLVQSLESVINDVVFAGIAVWWVFTVETQLKRRRAVAQLRELRALAHVIDLHQLAKDPDRDHSALDPTAHSPAAELQGELLARYLRYCTELLAVLGKLAALTAQHLDDPVTLSTVDEIETLTTGLSRKIWQKIVTAAPTAR